MHRFAQSLAATPLLALAACSGAGADESAGTAEGAHDVPEGVAAQYATLQEEVTQRGGSTTTAAWDVSYIVEAAEPWFERDGQHQELRDPAEGETHHLEVIPREKSTGRIVPDVPITVEVLDDSGTVVTESELSFYYSTFFHYADNVSVPRSGEYDLRVTLGVPDFRRHGEEGEAPALSEGATVTFQDVSLDRD